MLIGTWFGEQPTKESGIKEWQITNRIDGTYEITYKVTNSNGASHVSTEFGLWGISGDIYFMITKYWDRYGEYSLSDSKDAFSYTAYKVEHISSSKLIYKSYKSGNKYVVNKIKL